MFVVGIFAGVRSQLSSLDDRIPVSKLRDKDDGPIDFPLDEIDCGASISITVYNDTDAPKNFSLTLLGDGVMKPVDSEKQAMRDKIVKRLTE